MPPLNITQACILSTQSNYFFDRSCYDLDALTPSPGVCFGVDDANDISYSIFIGLRVGYLLQKILVTLFSSYSALNGGVPRPDGVIGVMLYFLWTACIQLQVVFTFIELMLKVFKLASIQDQSECMLRINSQYGYLNLISPVLFVHPDIMSSVWQIFILVVAAAAGSRFIFCKDAKNGEVKFDSYFLSFTAPFVILPSIGIVIGVIWWIITLGFLYSLIFFGIPVIGVSIFYLFTQYFCCLCFPGCNFFGYAAMEMVATLHNQHENLVSEGGFKACFDFVVKVMGAVLLVLFLSQWIIMGELAAFFSYNGENTADDFGDFVKFLILNYYNFSDLNFDIDFTMAPELPSLIDLLQSLSKSTVAGLSRGVTICGTLNFILAALKLTINAITYVLECSNFFNLGKPVEIIFCLSAKSLSNGRPVDPPSPVIALKNLPPQCQIIDRDADEDVKEVSVELDDKNNHGNPLRASDTAVCSV